ncbi:sugar O-acyltransferase, sialic acid O-acetyltransferase NeuD family [Trichococcus flocculiformis]|uniref:acetyltransferase n=1 Tax=Trichococcus TaxID=82802 RepID=UPI0007A8090C|nr:MULTISPECIES: acetyltransferase [Trichococcus]CZR05580.1 Hypothetical protein TES5_2201 [Trichococcus sp. ES5]SHF89045.1 sugar O-acyltransferase, sialic acid O-acetyltransferase NeuD family [Trichococcus flocculiformis]
MNESLIIIGASGHGKVVADIAMKMNKWKNISFLDDNQSLKTIMGIPVIGNSTNVVEHQKNSDFFVAIGNNSTRERIQEGLLAQGTSIVSLVHPSAIIGTDVNVGIGTAIMAGVVINSSTVVGKGCIINSNSGLDHDNNISDYVHISPRTHLAGTVNVGKGSWLGIGSVVSNNINICSGCKIGAGAVVVKDITESGTYVGVPVRRISG